MMIAQPVNGVGGIGCEWRRLQRTRACNRPGWRGGRSGAAVDGEANVQSRTEPVPIFRRSQRMMIRASSLNIDVTANPRFISKRESAAIGS
ncbi:hypothetical protein [Bradyrhizobium elkanii]|uniref:hypothetical protein n=1 Tax=Bradyrhizobium elkanii TaxID=29448 RepID=UPI002715569B|nr:hypothetical protein [Bradyrhizobium elkanii]WLB82424.1 hypothetical protein QIH83_07520 [Bradyrhizobium elkanii]